MTIRIAVGCAILAISIGMPVDGAPLRRLSDVYRAAKAAQAAESPHATSGQLTKAGQELKTAILIAEDVVLTLSEKQALKYYSDGLTEFERAISKIEISEKKRAEADETMNHLDPKDLKGGLGIELNAELATAYAISRAGDAHRDISAAREIWLHVDALFSKGHAIYLNEPVSKTPKH
jgi:hypothetical protein